jgi:hypothetical protein
VIVERLHLVPQASQHHGDPADWYLDLLEVYSNEVLDRRYRDIVRPKRLYVSRTKQALEGGLLGETFLERWLQGVGFEPFYPESHSFSEQMDCYRKAEYVIFAQGSACHGTELLGRRGLRSAILIPKSIKSDFFRRILYPRSRRFSVAGSPNQIGTMYYNSETRFQYIHLGVSLVDFPALAGCLKADGIAPPRVKPWAYRLAAAHDLRRYIAGAFQENGADLRQAARLIIAFLTKAFRTKGMSSD